MSAIEILAFALVAANIVALAVSIFGSDNFAPIWFAVLCASVGGIAVCAVTL